MQFCKYLSLYVTFLTVFNKILLNNTRPGEISAKPPTLDGDARTYTPAALFQGQYVISNQFVYAWTLQSAEHVTAIFTCNINMETVFLGI